MRTVYWRLFKSLLYYSACTYVINASISPEAALIVAAGFTTKKSSCDSTTSWPVMTAMAHIEAQLPFEAEVLRRLWRSPMRVSLPLTPAMPSSSSIWGCVNPLAIGPRVWSSFGVNINNPYTRLEENGDQVRVVQGIAVLPRLSH
jgi:hypothetical protein